ncbi:protein adenylyltransferase SelO family protein [Marinobacter sp. SS13-12]|uniref:protein adenylyltransferase SelO n=1 Tax=Marinobacter sp. SS13-12 TaxID=3050451 RepID=UPI002556FE97|nr:protein adenylyltransferase SelO family protein [Marinobacter sp. SS13-12]MDK8464983.1 protein adenylyltransferase SelO family protein [Marinobacter sp. SS13-12]
MENRSPRTTSFEVTSLEELAPMADYSLMDNLNCDPEADPDGVDHMPRQVFTGHYVPVRPTPIEAPEYVAHSEDLFRELGFADSLAQSTDFVRMFSGDLAQVPEPMRKVGWACGYALSIYGTEYTQQCPFQTGNGYGDGRAISVLEGVFNGRRREMQLKGGGRTPYCRGADGRAVLRSSVREFLAQEHMHALGVPTSRSLSLYVSKTEKVMRPWYSEGSRMRDPDQMIAEPVAISTRVAPSFIRVGQLELFSRRARRQEHPKAMEELEQLVLHLIDREYAGVIDQSLDTPTKVVMLAREFRGRLASLVANWIRVGYCQGNFNSDNCAAGGFTLDYGPFGFCEVFDPLYQPWTGGGQHFSFLNQPVAAERNFRMFCLALQPLLNAHQREMAQLEEIHAGFPEVMKAEMEKMWAAKLGLDAFDAGLFRELMALMTQTPVDYTLFFRELSSIPDDIEPLKKSFYRPPNEAGAADSAALFRRWAQWLTEWKSRIGRTREMKVVNPKYTMREWLVVPVYQQAAEGHYQPLKTLQGVLTQPYAEQSERAEEQYYRLKPSELFDLGGFSYYSCSS